MQLHRMLASVRKERFKGWITNSCNTVQKEFLKILVWWRKNREIHFTNKHLLLFIFKSNTNCLKSMK